MNNRDMTLYEVQKAKVELEFELTEKIDSIIKKFSKKNGLNVGEINVHLVRAGAFGEKSHVVLAGVDVGIDIFGD